MIAGKEMDALVAEKVMGWPTTGMAAGASYREANMPAYSTDIAAAWQVVEKLRTIGWFIELNDDRPPTGKQRWNCWFHWPYGPVLPEEWPSGEPDAGVAGVAPEAICLAALAAVGAEVPA